MRRLPSLRRGIERDWEDNWGLWQRRMDEENPFFAADHTRSGGKQQFGQEALVGELFFPPTVRDSSRIARKEGRRSQRQAWSTAATAACSVRPRPGAGSG